MNSGSRCMRKRVFGSLPNQPARRGQFRVSSMSLMDKGACDRAGTGVEIFIGTPNREVDVPVMQRKRHVADSVGEINTNCDSVLPGCRRNRRNVEQLTRKKIHTAD